MKTLFIRHAASQLIREIDPDMPQQVHQLTRQLETKFQEILHDFGYYGLFLAGFMAAIALLFGGLLFILNDSRSKSVQRCLGSIPRKSTYRQRTRVADTPIAKANRNELRLVSARIRAGQLSN